MKKIMFSLILILSLAACGGQIPSAETAHGILTKNFKKYGHKYKVSDFGKYPLDHVEIIEVRGMQNNWAEVAAYTILTGGPVYKVRATLQKKPFGWKFVSWETLGVQ